MDTLKENVANYFSDTPKWAKIVRFTGLIIGAAGGAILTGGASIPATLVVAAPYMVMVGNFAALFVQKYTQKK
jgi:hypothetical protein